MSSLKEKSMQTRTLTAGVEIPYVGLGTYLIPKDAVAQTVSEAIRVGYRHIDTAEGYGNEVGVGEGIRLATASEGLTRSDIFVTTKLWPGNAAWGQTPKSAEATVASLGESLSLIHI
jgi:2,5-diketo-D-gluconate reductase A